MNPFLATDGYKTSHPPMYPDGTTLVYDNFTPRSNKHAPKGCDEVVVFGSQMTMMIIHEMFEEHFFRREIFHTDNNLEQHLLRHAAIKKEVCGEIKKEYSMYLGYDFDVSHIERLWDLGYLPINVKSLPEGTMCPMGVPVVTLYNTHPDFFWLPNFLETLISTLLWKPMTSATIAYQYRKVLTKWAKKTDETQLAFVDFQGHDFSMRGMDAITAVQSSGLGHATSFLGSDSLPVIHAARKYYGERDFVVGSIPATEHSVMCAGTKDDEIGTFRRLMEKFPTGMLGIVSDTWDLWKVVGPGGICEQLKDEILARDGKIVIRPDSGDPVDIICGDISQYRYELEDGEEYLNGPQEKGVIELLWDVFGGTVNEQGYKILDSHIGAIYGDSITLVRAEEICRRLESKGFASTNIVLGVGSFTYQFNTRDTFGFAMKATYIELTHSPEKEGGTGYIEPREIFKDPITDDGTKKSAKGLLTVHKSENGYELIDGVEWEQEGLGELETIYLDGKFTNKVTLTEIRELLKQQ